MKKVLLLAIVLLGTLYTYAEPIDKITAQSTAESYLASKGKTLLKSATSFKAPQRRVGQQSSSSYYYVFNAGNEQGYVIVSGDDRTSEILGYVDQGTFDENSIPDNMKSWLQLYVDQIKYLDENNVQVDKTVLKARRKMESTRHSVPVLMTTKWNQGHPYNLTCPKYYKGDGTQAYPASGCVATALSQVINYYKYPEKTKTIIPAISNSYTLDDGTKKTVTTKYIPRASVIDWANMKDTYSCSDSHQHDAADTAVANLMYYVGQAVHMGYGASSGAVMGSNVSTAFIKYFGFDDSCYMAYRSDFSLDDWFNLVYNEIATGHPVAFSGSSSGGAHAFVLDGFDGDQLFHVNWGWGGGSDGWFLIGILNPGDTSGIGASSSSDGYSMGQTALIGVKLPDSHKDNPDPLHCTIHSITINDTNIKGTFINWTGSTNSFNTGVVRQKEDGTYALVGSSQTISNMSANTYQDKTFSVKNRLSEGTYKLSPASKLSSGSVWVPELNMRDEYILAEVDSLKNITLSYVKPVASISVDTIKYMGCCIVNQEQEVKVTFKNNGDEYYKEVRLFTAQPDSAFKDSENRSIVAVRKGESVDVSFYFKPTVTGTYRLRFCRNSDGTDVVADTIMQVVEEAQASKANLGVSAFTFLNSASGVIYGNRLTGKVTIRNNGTKQYTGNVKLDLWRQPVGSNVAWSSSSQMVQVDIAPAKTQICNFEFDNLDYGPTYRIAVNYTTQSGSLTSGGLWDHGWVCKAGIVNWKSASGSIVAAATKTLVTTSTAYCASYFNGLSVNRVMPNKSNPNCIYDFVNCTKLPTGVDDRNMVVDGHADTIRLTNDYAYYCPTTFTADTAIYTHIFPDECDGTGWQTFTLPFKADSLYVDGEQCELNDTVKNHFHIYEFSYIDDNGSVGFTPVTSLRANTPYIIAGDRYMAGQSLVFTATNAKFYQSGSDKMLVKSNAYQFYGTTYTQSIKNAYVLNEAGTAFDYVTTATSLKAGHTYFLTSLDDESRADSIPLPLIPVNDNIPDVVASLKAQSVMSNAVYSLTGQRVGESLRGLKPGIYVVAGRKIMVR